MTIKKGFKLFSACGQNFLVPMGEGNIDYSKLISLNESSLLLWQRMEKGEFSIDDLVAILLEEYEIDDATARKDVETMIEQYKQEGIIVE